MLKNALSAKSLPTLKPGKYRDGEGLQFEVKGKSRRWTFTYYLNSKAHELPIGGFPAMSLSAAREKRAVLRDAKDRGIDPAEVLRGPVARPGLTFEADVRRYIDHMSGHWVGTHRSDWAGSVVRFAGALLSRQTTSLTQADILAAVAPVWMTKHHTAEKVVQRIAAVINHATAIDPARFAGFTNPCLNIALHLPRVAVKVEPRAAMPWRELPAFFAELKGRPEPQARAIEFLLLTCCPRVSEVARAEWDEIDGSRWNVPAEHMKSGRARTIPLSPAAIRILLDLADKTGEKIFGVPHDSVQRFLREEMGSEYTVHGFRSSFMDWVAEVHPARLMEAERALDHTIGNQVQRAYLRTDLFDQRAELAAMWAEFLGA